jgi:hypothetical protein
MKYLDHLCAWAIFLTALVSVVVIAFWHPRGTTLEAPLLWILVAMMNFLRLRNGYSGTRGLRTFCIAANLIALTVEIVRFGLFGSWIFESGGFYYLFSTSKAWTAYLIVAVAAFGETIFSALQRTATEESARA